MDNFLPHTDGLAQHINSCAGQLYGQLKKLDASKLGLPYHCLYYYNASHSRRLFFSLETSAHLLYNSIQMTGKTCSELAVMDYGAGVGTLYLLAKKIGCRQVVYNDHLADWQLSAQLIAEAIDLPVDEYIVGDIDACLDHLDSIGLQCDIITSRNVIEHIYKLDIFYKALRERQPQAIVFSSTTANIKNPATVIKHIAWHRKWEKIYRQKRLHIIEGQMPLMDKAKKLVLAKATQGLAGAELTDAITRFADTGILPDARPHKTNTCDPDNGVWAEHLLDFDEYTRLIGDSSYYIQFAPGFWDTHYSKNYMNMLGKTMNKIIRKGGNSAMRAAPFIYVIATPKP